MARLVGQLLAKLHGRCDTHRRPGVRRYLFLEGRSDLKELEIRPGVRPTVAGMARCAVGGERGGAEGRCRGGGVPTAERLREREGERERPSEVRGDARFSRRFLCFLLV